MRQEYRTALLILVTISVIAIAGCVTTFSSQEECRKACIEAGYDNGGCVPVAPNGTLYPILGACNANICLNLSEGYTCGCHCFNET